MAVPDYQTFMLPVLRYAAAKPTNEIPLRELLARSYDVKRIDSDYFADEE